MSKMQRTYLQVLSADTDDRCEDTDVGVHLCGVQHSNGSDSTELESRGSEGMKKRNIDPVLGFCINCRFADVIDTCNGIVKCEKLKRRLNGYCTCESYRDVRD